MAQTGKGNAEKVLGSALSVPMNIIIGLADLLIAKDVISREEMVSLLQRMADHSQRHGEHEDMVSVRFVELVPPRRIVQAVTYEHRFVNAGFEYLKTEDQISITRNEADGSGYSIWATPKSPMGLEALLRYDHLKPNSTFDNQVRNRTIAGVSYWFPHQGNVAAALLLDYDGQTFDNFAPAISKNTRVAVHGLIQF